MATPRVQEVAGLLEDLGLSTSLSDSELEAALRGGPAASDSSRRLWIKGHPKEEPRRILNQILNKP